MEMKNQQKSIQKFETIDDKKLQAMNGGVLPVVIPVGWVILGKSFALGASLGAVIGISGSSRKKG